MLNTENYGDNEYTREVADMLERYIRELEECDNQRLNLAIELAENELFLAKDWLNG